MGQVDSKRRGRAAALLGAVAIALAACGGGPAAAPTTTAPTTAATDTVSTSSDAPIAAASDLAAAESRWSATAPSTYSLVFEDDCGECERREGAQIVVWDGEPASADEVPAVEEVFAAIAAAIEAGRDVDVTYDGVTGLPTEVWIDQEARAHDGGTHWVLHSYAQALPGDAASLERLREAERRWALHGPAHYSFRTGIICDCELAGWLWTEVEDGRLIDFEAELATGASPSPITIDEMLDDLGELFTVGVREDGVRITGSAAYDADLGHPTWIGLDIEVEDPAGELAHLPPRLVFAVTDFTELAPTGTGNGTGLTDGRAAQQRWVTAALDDYSYELTVHDIATADFSDPYTVTVVAGEVVAVTLGGAQVDPASVPAYSIDRLFAMMGQWTQDGSDVEALYDATTGHPVLVIRRSADPLVISIDVLTAN